MPPPPYRFKPLALKLTETWGAMWQSNHLFSIVVGASFDEAVLSFLSIRDWSLSLENCYKILKSLVRVCIKSIKRPNGRKTYVSYTSTLSTCHVERWTACTCSNSSIAILYWIGSLDPKFLTVDPKLFLRIQSFYSGSKVITPNPKFFLQIKGFYFGSKDQIQYNIAILKIWTCACS